MCSSPTDSACGAKGRGFESRRGRHLLTRDHLSAELGRVSGLLLLKYESALTL
jgi:hypothetical protein